MKYTPIQGNYLLRGGLDHGTQHTADQRKVLPSTPVSQHHGAQKPWLSERTAPGKAAYKTGAQTI